MSLSPPCSLNCRDNPVLVSAKLANFAHFSRFLLVKPACGERTTVAVARTSPPFFSAAAIGSPTSSTPFGEDLAIGNRTSYEPYLTSFPGSPVPCQCPGCSSSAQNLWQASLRLPKSQKASGTLRRDSEPTGIEPRNYCSFAHSPLACFRMGMSGSASFQSVRKS
jgi:hypothetical protein